VSDHLDALAGIIASEVGRNRARGPVLVGITGAVAVGKSTTAAALAARVEGAGRSVAVVATDCFLLPAAELATRGLVMQKGFPGTFDDDLIVAALDALRAGATVEVPVYSHVVYDRVEGTTTRLAPTDVVVLEGVNALLAPIVDRLTLGVYIDASESDVEGWFHRRFEELAAAAAGDSSSFYAPIAALPVEQRRAIAGAAWTGINLVNLHDHIGPSRARADYVLTKGPDHAFVGLEQIAARRRCG